LGLAARQRQLDNSNPHKSGSEQQKRNQDHENVHDRRDIEIRI